MTLQITTDIPYGNACGISVSNVKGLPRVEFAAHPRGAPESLWFCLRLEDEGDAVPPKGVRLVLKHVENILGGGKPAKMRPVARDAGGDWERIKPGRSILLPDGRRQAQWMVSYPSPALDIALCYPYGRREIDELVCDSEGHWQIDEVGVSHCGRPLIRLSNYEVAGQPSNPGIFLIARQHSGETPGSWVLDGFMRHIASLERSAPLIWAIPLANMDGVEEGNYGKDNYPYDLNRAWGKPPMRHETLVYMRDMARWLKRCKPTMGIDFHAPGCCESEGIYAFLPKPDEFPECHERASRAAKLIAQALGRRYIARPFGRAPGWVSRWNTPGFSSYCCSMGFCAFGVETPYSQIRDLVLTREHYREAGRRMAKGVLRYIRRTASGSEKISG